MSGSQVVGLVFAVAVVVGACFLALVLVRVTELLLTVKGTLSTLTAAALPLLEQAEQAAKTGNEGMVKVAAITDNIQAVTDDVSAVAATAGAVVGGPMVKTAKYSLSARRIITSRRAPDRAKQVKAELAAERRGRRRGARSAAPDTATATATTTTTATATATATATDKRRSRRKS
ncbi:hypothetical protein [Catenulispora pinisilvae]|uniref:hypothetical protein n=1 Tax=Catenulispora pinisilvae TaxID=2705253 RepID=UPI0018922688|nr:hypothetical protein [Catenulispora pinisilvae]